MTEFGGVSLVLLVGMALLVFANRITKDDVHDVAKACSLYGRYYVEPPSDNDPMGYYINCNVTGGPVIAPSKRGTSESASGTEGKKK